MAELAKKIKFFNTFLIVFEGNFFSIKVGYNTWQFTG